MKKYKFSIVLVVILCFSVLPAYTTISGTENIVETNNDLKNEVSEKQKKIWAKDFNNLVKIENLRLLKSYKLYLEMPQEQFPDKVWAYQSNDCSGTAILVTYGELNGGPWQTFKLALEGDYVGATCFDVPETGGIE